MCTASIAAFGRWVFQLSLTESPRKSPDGYLEPILEPVFHADSYGYRPGKSPPSLFGISTRRTGGGK